MTLKAPQWSTGPNWPDKSSRTEAQRYLNTSASWKAYLGMVGKTTKDEWLSAKHLKGLNEFSLVLQLQMPLLQTKKVQEFWMSPKVVFGDDNFFRTIDEPISFEGSTLSSPTPSQTRSYTDIEMGDDSDDPDLHDGGENILPVTPPHQTHTGSSRPSSQSARETSMEVDTPSLTASPYGALSLQQRMLNGDQIEDVVDEEIVNISLLLFLQGLVGHCDAARCWWSSHRQPFVFRRQNNKKIYESRVDGFLQRWSDSSTRALVEVKPFRRSNATANSIQMQESAQMVAWIRQDPPPQSELDACRTNSTTMT